MPRTNIELSALKKENAKLKKALERKETLERTLTEVAVNFVFPSKLDSAIDHALKELLYWSGADRAMVMQLNADNENFMGVTHEACKLGVFRAKKFVQNIPVVEYKYFEKTQRKYGYIALTDTKLLPEDAVEERALYKRSRLRAAATCSFTSRKKFRGLVGIYNRKPVKEWNPEILQFLTTLTILMEHSIERIEVEKKLIIAKEQAEESDRLKTSFMANLSHEIRTPLNGILGFTNLLTQRMLTEQKQKQYAGVIEVNSHQLLTILDDLLDISKIESGAVKIESHDVRINVLMTTIYDYFLNELVNNPLVKLSLEIPDLSIDYKLRTDPTRLKQVIDNLVKNAIKFTPKGQISLGYTIEKKHLYIYTADTGIGIEKKNQKIIFKRFWQLDSSISHPYGGNGLGLSITHDLVELMGGKISVNSEPGKGSKFVVELPYNEIIHKN